MFTMQRDHVLDGTMLPDTLIVGPLKSGTTWIADYLEDRGDICLPHGVKETFFFDRHFGMSPHWYARHFEHFEPKVHDLTVEVAPTYFDDEVAAHRIRETLGLVTIVWVLRDPVERSWSHYLHMRRKGYTRLPLRAAAEEFPSIVDASRYSIHVRRWQELMGSERVYGLEFADLRADAGDFSEKLSTLLGLTPRAPSVARLQPSNVSGTARSFRLARMSRKAAEGLRKRQLHWAVNAAKKMGINSAVYGSAKSRASRSEELTITESDEEWLRSILDEEYKRLPETISAHSG